VVLLESHLVKEGDLRILRRVLMACNEPVLSYFNLGHYTLFLNEAIRSTDLDTDLEPHLGKKSQS